MGRLSQKSFLCAVQVEVRERLGLLPCAQPLDPAIRGRLLQPLRKLVEEYTGGSLQPLLTRIESESAAAAFLAYYGVRSFLVTRLLAEAYGLDGHRVLDLGAGPGVAALAILDDGDDASWSIVEPSARLAASARALAARCGLSAPGKLGGTVAEVRAPAESPTTIVAANTLCEWPGSPRQRAERLVEIAGWLAPGGALVVIEPARRHTARALSEVRGHLIEGGLRVEGPCTHMGPCPMLERRRDFCHGRQRLDIPEDLAALGREAKNLDLADADFASLVCTRAGGPRLHGFRAVGDVRREKGRDRLFLCGEAGLLECFALNRRGAPARGVLDSLRRGDVVDFLPPPDESPLRIDDPSTLQRVGWMP